MAESPRREEAWREAEEIAAIADTMFLPDGTEQRLEGLRRRVPGADPTA